MGNIVVQLPGFADLEALYWFVHVQCGNFAKMTGL